MSSVLFTVVVLLVVLGFLIFIHELGHYWAAKAFGVWVHRFAVGMGSPVKRLSFRRGETEWAIAWLPLGGYVKMASREEDPAAGVLEGGAENAVVPPDRVFEAKPVWQRMVIILAGVTVNLLFAWLVFVGLAFKNGRQFDPETRLGRVIVDALPAGAEAMAGAPVGVAITSVDGRTVDSWNDVGEFITHGLRDTIVISFENGHEVRIPMHRDQLVERAELSQALLPRHAAVIGNIVQASAAEEAGLQVGDSVVAVDGKPLQWWSDFTARIEPAGGREVSVTVVREGATLDVPVTPRLERRIPGDSTSELIGRLGVVQHQPTVHEPYTFAGAIKAGNSATWSAAGLIFRTLRGLVTRRVDSSQVGGPIMIGQMAARSAQLGIEPLLAFMALISVNLAVVNLLPIPVLDGGAFLILAVEAIIRRPLPNRLREGMQLIGLLLVVALMVLAFSNDIRRLLGFG
jgi:regulator of sigma E protease